jgi:spore coat protein U-like protein
MKRLAIATALIGIVTAMTHAFGAIELQDHPSNVSGTYDDGFDLVLSQTLTVENTGSATEDYVVFFNAGGSGSTDDRRLTRTGGNEELAYQIFDNTNDRNILRARGEATSDVDVLTGTLSAGASVVEPFVVVILADQSPPGGTYTDSITIAARRGTVSSNSFGLNGLGVMNVSVSVPSFISIGISAPGAGFAGGSVSYTLDLGSIQAGTEGFAEVLISGNTGYVVTARSGNGQVLLPEDPGIPSTGDNIIGYTFSVDTGTGLQLTDLSGSAEVQIASGTAPTAVSRYPVAIEIPTVGFPSSGTYSDTITFTVSAQ